MTHVPKARKFAVTDQVFPFPLVRLNEILLVTHEVALVGRDRCKGCRRCGCGGQW